MRRILLLALALCLTSPVLAKKKADKDSILHYKKGPLTLKVGGHFSFGATFYQPDVKDMGNGTDVDIAKIKFSGDIKPDWRYRLEFDFANKDVKIKDAYLRYIAFDPLRIMVGHFKAPFELEQLDKKEDQTFIEPALPTTFAPGYGLGIGVSTYGKFPHKNSYTANIAVFGQEAGTDSDSEGNEAFNTSGRFTLSHLFSKTKVITSGLGLAYGRPDSKGEVKYDTRPEAKVSDAKLVDTGDIKHIKSTELLDINAATTYGPVSLQGSYYFTHVTRDPGHNDLSFDGWYTYVSWTITGETRPFDIKTAKFKRIEPKHRYGAWEVALRYSTINLNDKSVSGGRENNITAGLNWYANDYIKFAANYIWAFSKKEGIQDDPRIIALEGEIRF